MDIPVYLIAGFLDAGKTEFINGILRDGFAAEDRTLLICCEEGEEEYDPKALNNVFTYTVEDQAELTVELLKKLEKQYKPKQVIIEYNGMWMMEPLYRQALPGNWVLYQIICLMDAHTFEPYLKNMGQLVMEKVSNADMLIFNRCNEQLRSQLRAKNLRMANRRADIYLENEDGERFEPISSGISATGGEDSPAYVSFRLESPYFADSQHLTLHITGAEWLDKDMERVRVDLANRTAERLPEGVTFRSAEKRDGGWVLSFRVKKREENHTHQVWYSTFYDEAGNQYEANRRGTTTDDSGCFEEMMPLPGYQENVVWLQPTYSRTTTEITPVTIPIK